MRRRHLARRRIVLVLAGAVSYPIWVHCRQAPVFRTEIHVVSLPVSVTRGGTAVTGLTPADFEVTDNSVPQLVDDVLSTEVPIDVSVLVDVSGSTADDLDQYVEDVPQLLEILRPGDRMRLVAFGTDVVEVFPLQAAGVTVSLERLQTAGLTTLHDALGEALMRHVPLDRRHLVVAFTDGNDNMSVLSAEHVLGIARRTPAVLHLVLTEGGAGVPALSRRQPVMQWIDASGKELLLDAAAITGGRRGWPGVFTGSILNAFREAFDDMRASYLIRYRPRGVSAPGWHHVSVEVPNRRATVRARRGYFVGR